MIIEICKNTRMVNLSKSFLGNELENLQEKLIFKFSDTFVDGQARLEYEHDGEKNYIILEKEEESYTIPVKNVLTKRGQITMQLVITEGTDEEETPVFKSNEFYLFCNKSINAIEEAPDGYELWIEQANVKLNQIDNLDIEATKEGNISTITITKKDGSQESVKIYDGESGKGTFNYNELDNKPSVNNIIIEGSKTLDELGIQPTGDYIETQEFTSELNKLGVKIEEVENKIPDVSNFITNTVDNLVNYYQKDETYNKEDINERVSKIPKMHFEKVDRLPDIGDEETIYLVPSQNPSEQNECEEYIYIDGKYELLGTTKIDLSPIEHDIENLTDLIKENQDNIVKLQKADIDRFTTSKPSGEGIITINAVTKNNQNIQALTLYDGLDGKYLYSAASGKAVYDLNNKIGDIDKVLDVINGEVI